MIERFPGLKQAGEAERKTYIYDSNLFHSAWQASGKSQGAYYNAKKKAMSSTTPDKTVLYENFIATRYMEAAGEQRFSDGAYIKARIQAFYEIPKSSSKVKKTAMLSGELLPTKKPDIDNIVKAVLDALNEVAYRDDTQVVELQVRKQYSERPRLEICLEELEA